MHKNKSARGSRKKNVSYSSEKTFYNIKIHTVFTVLILNKAHHSVMHVGVMILTQKRFSLQKNKDTELTETRMNNQYSLVFYYPVSTENNLSQLWRVGVIYIYIFE